MVIFHSYVSLPEGNKEIMMNNEQLVISGVPRL